MNVTIIMPVYNEVEYLQAAIDSILNQTYKQFEFIIIDDGSSLVETRKILESQTDERIKIYYKKHEGITRALNLGLGVATGKYIFRQDADDISMPFRIEKTLEIFEANPNLNIVCTISNFINENGEIVGESQYYNNITNIIKEINPIIHGSVAFHYKLITEVGLYDEQFPICQSYEYWLRISQSYDIYMIPIVLYQFRRYSNSYTTVYSEYNKYIRESIRDLYSNNYRTKLNNYEYYKMNAKNILNIQNKQKTTFV
ncbi:glycosyltransferase [Niallia sp. HCP3S3_B10]|uniref:glycosyltransferase n=1 Tax=Niallia sp. HCP3S3_B10 TaxID=3438944 RepID=UPI003F8A9FE7